MHGDAKTQRILGEEIERCAYAVVGAALEVHRRLGPGLLEAVYEEALAIEFRYRGIKFERQFSIPLLYREAVIGEYRFDFLIENQLVVELKAVERLAPVHFAQVLTYLRVGYYDLGLLINFDVALLKEGIRRIIAPELLAP